MATETIYLTGNQIGIYDSVSMSGNSNGVKVTLNGVETLGSETDIFRVEITQVTDGDGSFQNGQFVAIYAYPDTDPPSPPIYSSLNPQDDQFQGRASSSEHQIFTSPDNIVFDVNGLEEGDVRYGPGKYPLRSEQLEFDAFPSTPPIVPCFAKGTRIRVPDGTRRIEDLRVGDFVHTLDHGPQRIRWISARTVPALGRFAPIEFAAGSLGNRRKLVVSPEHRMLIRGWRAEVCFGEDEVFVAAKHLVNDQTIRQISGGEVSYYHMTFDRHEIVFAEGIPSESLHLGDMALRSMTRDARAEIIELFPELAGTASRPGTARRCLKAWEARVVA
ncbi:Hint domain-containing protein [Flavimaricola marinus]|uniref:Hedgehog/Intein (Hint) domain-containing protein n=1 Tax=Flavimaricola marinus TaxID=1819565 RepID=A0A238LEP4_9RHOB|nr:Hint domain-containing protein [Flavimaricola marinus]SMY07885.1 hypothetical protein LOM8899_02028 [Flavimaricola marinus]